MIALTQVSTFVAVMVVAILSGISERGVAGIAGGLVHDLSTRDTRMEARALLRTTTNVGIGIGTLVAGVVLALDSPAAYRASLVVNALAYAATATLVARLPTSRRTRATRGRGRARRPDARYMAVSAACGALSLQIPVVSFVLPLWVASRTDAPLWSVSAVIALNTIVVVLTQVRVSRRVKDFRSAHRATATATLCLIASCAAISATHDATVWATMALLLVWCLLMTAAELFQSTSQFFYSFELAPDDAQSSFQSAFSIGPGAVRAIGPSFLVVLVMDNPSWGWFALAGVFALGGFFQVLTARWAMSSVVPEQPREPSDRGPHE